MDFAARKQTVIASFHTVFHHQPNDLFSSSGRVEILGNHTDHNHGLVLVGAINQDILAATAKRSDDKVIVLSEGFPLVEIDLKNLAMVEEEKGKSIAIIKGVLFRLKEDGYAIGGFTCYAQSTVYQGAGVSSSAAFECLFVEIINYYYNQGQMERFEIARIAQYAETTYFGKPCGLLDQCGVAFGGVTAIDFKDTRKPKIEHIEVNFAPYQMVLVNTGGDHSNLTEHYASITQEMKQVAGFFRKKHLRSVKEKDFVQSMALLRATVSDRAILRAIHFFEENRHVNKGFKALQKGNMKNFLAAINASGRNSFECLQNNYVPSSTHQNIPLALGYTRYLLKRGAVRVHGGGFEGTILAFVHEEDVASYCEKMSEVFGTSNVHLVSIRNEGSTHLEVL